MPLNHLMMLALSALVRPHPLNSIRLNSTSGTTQATGPAPPRQQPAASFAPLSLALKVEVRSERQNTDTHPQKARVIINPLHTGHDACPILSDLGYNDTT